MAPTPKRRDAEVDKEEEEEEEEETVLKEEVDATLMFQVERWLSEAREAPPLDALSLVILNTDHKRIIKETWPLISHSLQDNGIVVFERIFEVSPSIRTVFAASFGFPPSPVPDAYELSQAPFLQDHVTRFMQAVGWSVQNLDDPDKMTAVFVSLGRHHIHMKSLQKEFFGVFSGALMYVWRSTIGPDLFTSQVRGAWSKLFEFMLQHLAHGYGLELQD